jgi:mannose-binding lectin 2
MFREYRFVAVIDWADEKEQFRRRDIPTKGRLTYVKSKSRLLVELQTKKSDEWLKCFETSIVLPESPYLGFTALTGDVSDAHE